MVQELLISTLYVYLFMNFMQHSTSRLRMRSTLYLLILAEALSLICDVTSIFLLYKKLVLPRMMTQSLIYVFKLRIEVVVLNNLTRLIKPDAEFLAPAFSIHAGENRPAGGSTLSQRFTETFSPLARTEEKDTVVDIEKSSVQQGESSSKTMTRHTTKTSSTIVDDGKADSITLTSSSASIEALEKQYLGRSGQA